MLTASLLSNHHRISHQNILRFRGYFEDHSDVFLVLDLAPHGDLSKWLPRDPEERFETAKVAVACVVEALSFLRGLRIAHRDLKPENVLVFGPTDYRLGDFGCACMGKLTRSTILGTPEYMAPELLRTKDPVYDAGGTDLWALGVLAYDLVYGESPFGSEEFQPAIEGNALSVLFRRIMRFMGPVVAPTTSVLGDTIDSSVQKFCSSLMENDPAQRMEPKAALQFLV
jgi:serine/threonine protein kinase